MSHGARAQSIATGSEVDDQNSTPQRQRPRSNWYRTASRRKVAIIAGLTALLCVTIAIDFLIGSSLNANEALYVLFHPSDSRPIDWQIIFDIRLPMTVTAVLIGGTLAACLLYTSPSPRD